jgi:hypothetical protein
MVLESIGGPLMILDDINIPKHLEPFSDVLRTCVHYGKHENKDEHAKALSRLVKIACHTDKEIDGPEVLAVSEFIAKQRAEIVRLRETIDDVNEKLATAIYRAAHWSVPTDKSQVDEITKAKT